MRDVWENMAFEPSRILVHSDFKFVFSLLVFGSLNLAVFDQSARACRGTAQCPSSVLGCTSTKCIHPEADKRLSTTYCGKVATVYSTHSICVFLLLISVIEFKHLFLLIWNLMIAKTPYLHYDCTVFIQVQSMWTLK